jgi:ureidoacrylate peracid hydrolase
MQQVLNCRAAGEASRLLCNASSLPPGDYKDLEIAPIQKAAWRNKSFEYGTWGGEIRAEFAPSLARS